jgi:hypothetical protein
VAPALRREFALGEGGGSTTPEEWDASVLRAGVAPDMESLGDESAVALPPSECSLGICTLNFGLFLSACWRLLTRVGGAMIGTVGVESVRCGGCGLEIFGGWGGWEGPLGCRRDMAHTSMD